MKGIGENSLIEIEPDCVTFLLNYFKIKLKNSIIYCIAPGSGGFDGVFFLVGKDFNEEIFNQEINEFTNIKWDKDNIHTFFFDNYKDNFIDQINSIEISPFYFNIYKGKMSVLEKNDEKFVEIKNFVESGNY